MRDLFFLVYSFLHVVEQCDSAVRIPSDDCDYWIKKKVS